MGNETKSTAPKPFIFVLMPFDEKYNDIYKFGIKGAAEDVGAYAERIDEQIFTEGILDRIFNQISKADVIVADMTKRNANVFYEVGYAHALGKVVLLLTQNSDDIPFDLQHRQHIVYGGKIETLRSRLNERLIWAISESKRQERPASERFIVSILETEIPEARFSHDIPVLKVGKWDSIPISISNGSQDTTPAISHIYLIASDDSELSIYSENPDSVKYDSRFCSDCIYSVTSESQDGLIMQFRLKAGIHPLTIPPLPPGAVEQFRIYPLLHKDELLKLRLHSSTNFYDFLFKLELK